MAPNGTRNTQGPQDSGSARAKKALDVLKNDTKANFQGNMTGKVQFQKNWDGHVPPSPSSSGGLIQYSIMPFTGSPFVCVKYYGLKLDLGLKFREKQTHLFRAV